MTPHGWGGWGNGVGEFGGRGLTVFGSGVQVVVGAEQAEELDPPTAEADADIRTAEEQRWEAKHGGSPMLHSVTQLRNCTASVPVLPPR